MATSARLLAITLAAVVGTACDAGPVAVPDGFDVAAQSAGVEKHTIGGTLGFFGAAPAARSIVTPSGRCHSWNVSVVTTLDGDIAGAVTFDEQQHHPCDFTDLVASGPFEGDVTWNGRTGQIEGQWRTNCDADPTQPLGLSCGGGMNARGSGGLEGVQFHIRFEPGWYPFTYTGTAFSR